jgi:hypothetical protein
MTTLTPAAQIIESSNRLLPLQQHCEDCPACDNYFNGSPDAEQAPCGHGKFLLTICRASIRTPIAEDDMEFARR